MEQVADVNKLIDSITDEEFNQDERLPYWAELWPSAQALANFILQNKYLFEGKKILELGCGLGLVGIAATIAEAKVLFTDYEAEALKFAKKNYLINFKKHAETAIFDWREPNLKKSFEIILAADVLYEKRFLNPVYNTLQNILQHGGKVYITEPNRSIAKPFFEMMKTGFELKEKQTINIQLDKNKSVTLYIFEKC